MATTYWPDLLLSRILYDADRSVAGDDDADVTGWDTSAKFILATQIGLDGKNTEASAYKLQWRDVTDEGSFADVASTGEIKWAATSAVLSDGTAVTDVTRRCTVQGSMTWANGLESVGDNLCPDSGTINLGSDEYTELQWALDPADADDSHEYEFLLYNNSEGASVGTCACTLTMAAGAVQTSDTRPARTEGCDTADDTRPARTEGYDIASDTRPARTEGTGWLVCGTRVARATFASYDPDIRDWIEDEDVNITNHDKSEHIIYAFAFGKASGATSNIYPEVEWRNVTDSGSWTVLGTTGEIRRSASTDLVHNDAVLEEETGCTGSGDYRIGYERENVSTLNVTVALTPPAEWSESQIAIDFSNALYEKEYAFRANNVTEGTGIIQGTYVTITTAKISDTRAARTEGYDITSDTRAARAEGFDTASDTRVARTEGCVTASSTRAARTEGVSSGTQVSDTRAARTEGLDIVSDARAARTEGYDTASDTRPARTEGYDLASDTRAARTEGYDLASDTRPARTEGYDIASDTRSARTEGYDTASDTRAARTEGLDIAADTRAARTEGYDTASDTRAARTKGLDIASDTRAARTEGYDTASSTRAARTEGIISGGTVTSSTRAARIEGAIFGGIIIRERALGSIQFIEPTVVIREREVGPITYIEDDVTIDESSQSDMVRFRRE